MTKQHKKDAASLPPFIGPLTEGLDDDMRRELRVNRDSELERCINLLYQRKSNLLLHGDIGVGKTFLVKLVHDQLTMDHSDVLTCYLNLLSGFYGYDDNVIAGFPNSVLLEICTTIWRSILGRDYSALRATTVESPGAIKFPNKAASKIVEIYCQLMNFKRAVQYNRENTFGASAIFKGQVKETSSKQWAPVDVLPFEFFHFLDELFTVILNKHGIHRIILICDEANKLSLYDQKEILLRYMELFAARNVQFVMVSRTEIAAAARIVFTTFDELALTGFSDPKDVDLLLSKHLSRTKIQATPSAAKVVWEVFQGNPLFTLNAAQEAYDAVLTQDKTVIDDGIMALACAKTLRRLHQMAKLESYSVSSKYPLSVD